MTAVVQPDLGPPPAHKYNDDHSDDSLRQLGSSNPPQSLPQHHGPGSLLHQHSRRPDSPRHNTAGSLPPGPYQSTSGLSSLSIQHPPPSQYPPPAHDQGYYASHAHHQYPATSTPAQYPSSGPPDLITASPQMQRPYPTTYHANPQSNSPNSVSSAQTHDQHGRGIYGQSPPLGSQLYSYQSYPPVPPMHPAYNPQPPTPQHSLTTSQHPLTTQPLMMPPQTAPIQHTLPSSHQPSLSNSSINTSPQPKVDSISHTPIQHPRPSLPPSSFTSPNISGQPPAAGNVQVSTNAAPGPIPATTPQIVRQDSNGVQWIAFEYSRDRVKMEYTIRCDVESVDIKALTPEFKTENCVYPRACCAKDQYKGNRLVYETECNAVGWALAELNPPLRGKRGLIQRAVDSWRNSNEDLRMRSRRVRRMQKMNRRQTTQPPNQLVGPHPTVVSHLLTNNSAGLASTTQSPRNAPSTLAAPPLQHHAHHSEGQSGNEEVSGSADLSSGAFRHSYVPTSAKRSISEADETAPIYGTEQMYHGMLPFPTATHTVSSFGLPSIAPPIVGSGFETIGRRTVTTSASQEHVSDDVYETEAANNKPGDKILFGNLPAGKRRKFLLIEDHQRDNRARIKVTLDRVNMSEIPDSYRLANAVFPRAYYPIQMKSPSGHTLPNSRYLEDHNDDNDDDNAREEDDEEEVEDFELGDSDDHEPVVVGRTIVSIPSIEGLSVPVPQLSRSRHRKDKILNDLGYRMSWSQSRVFAGRRLFLQQSLDAYRSKMRGTMITLEHEKTSIPAHFETRGGKRKYNARKERAREGRPPPLPTCRREAEEVEA